MKKFIGWYIWCTCEFLGIDLKSFAPIVFGWMIGCKGKKVNKIKK